MTKTRRQDQIADLKRILGALKRRVRSNLTVVLVGDQNVDPGCGPLRTVMDASPNL